MFSRNYSYYLSIVFLDGTGVIAEHHACVLDKIGGVTRQGLIPAKDQIHCIFRDVVSDRADVKTRILRFPVIAVLVEDRGRDDKASRSAERTHWPEIGRCLHRA